MKTFVETETFVVVHCYKCGIAFGLPKEFQSQALKLGNAKTWYCPNGHGQVYTKSEADNKDNGDVLEAATAPAIIEDKPLTEQVEVPGDYKAKHTKPLGKEKAICPQCGRSYKNKRSLRAHIYIYHRKAQGGEGQ